MTELSRQSACQASSGAIEIHQEENRALKALKDAIMSALGRLWADRGDLIGAIESKGFFRLSRFVTSDRPDETKVVLRIASRGLKMRNIAPLAVRSAFMQTGFGLQVKNLAETVMNKALRAVGNASGITNMR
jgi:hypothetical protein